MIANRNVQMKKQRHNSRLLRILERIEFDRPILMQDKLDVIWGDDPLPSGATAKRHT